MAGIDRAGWFAFPVPGRRGSKLVHANEVHRTAFDTPRHVEKTSAPSAHGGVDGDRSNRRVGLLGFANGRAGRRFSLLDAVYRAVSCGCAVDDISLDRPACDLAGVWHDVPVLELGRHWARSSRTQDVRP